jgi:hypothetical protein
MLFSKKGSKGAKNAKGNFVSSVSFTNSLAYKSHSYGLSELSTPEVKEQWLVDTIQWMVIITAIISLVVSLTTNSATAPPASVYSSINGRVVNTAVSASHYCSFDRSNYLAVTWSAYNTSLKLYNKDSTLSTYTLDWVGNAAVNNTAVIKYDYRGKVSQVLHLGELGSSDIAAVTSISCKDSVVYIGGTVYNQLVINDFNRKLNDTDLIEESESVFILKYGIKSGSYLSSSFAFMEDTRCEMLDMNATTNSIYAAVTCKDSDGTKALTVYDFCYDINTACDYREITALDLAYNAFTLRYTLGEFTGYAKLPSDTYKAMTYKSTSVYSAGNFAPDNSANFTGFDLVNPSTLLSYPVSFFESAVEYAYVYNRETNKAIWIDCPSFYITAVSSGEYTLVATDLYSSVVFEQPVKIWRPGNTVKATPDKTILFASIYDVIIIKTNSYSDVEIVGFKGAPLMISDFQLTSSGNMLISMNFLSELESDRTITVTKFDGSVSDKSIVLTEPCYYLFVNLRADGQVVNYLCLDSQIQPLSVINYGMFLSVPPKGNTPSISSAIVNKTSVVGTFKGTPAALNSYYNLDLGNIVHKI